MCIEELEGCKQFVSLYHIRSIFQYSQVTTHSLHIKSHISAKMFLLLTLFIANFSETFQICSLGKYMKSSIGS